MSLFLVFLDKIFKVAGGRYIQIQIQLKHAFARLQQITRRQEDNKM